MLKNFNLINKLYIKFFKIKFYYLSYKYLNIILINFNINLNP